MNKGLIFDLDGTLWDAVNEIQASWNLSMQKEHLTRFFSYQEIKSYMGLTPEETIPLAFPNYTNGNQLFSTCIKDEIAYLALHPGKLYPFEKETLEFLKTKYSLFIVSNCEKGYIENYLSSLNMGKYFTSYLCAGDTKKDKHENILIIKNIFSLDDIIYIGDTLKDYLECQKANVKFIYAKYGFGTIKNKVNYINEFKDLPLLVNKLF